MLEALDADAVRAWSRTTVERLTAHRSEINALNVFPVADSDTGNNLLTTFRAADDAIAATAGTTDTTDSADTATTTPATAAQVLRTMAGAAARGAVGNSGFIASQVLRGLADAADGSELCDARVLVTGLDAGAELGRSAVVGPLEGTILTVASAAAGAARAALASGGGLVAVARAAFTAADAALARTPEQLADLAEAGVVDAGGRGLVVALAALVEVVTGDEVRLAPTAVPADPVAAPGGSPAPAHLADADGYGFEVQYLLDAPDAGVAGLRSALARLGGSVAVVAAGPGSWNVHVHADDVGAVIEAGVDAGRPSRITVTRFADAPDPYGAPGSHLPASGGTAVVAVAPGQGLAHLFEREGVRVVDGGSDDLPTVDEVVEAITATGAGQIVLLPNATRVTGVAEAAADTVRAGGLRATVVPTRSPVQGLSAVAVHDAGRRFDDDVVAMAEAAAATRHAEVSVARSEALTSVGICQPGDILGSIDGEIVEIGRGLLAVVFGLVDRLVGVGVELMTIVVGEGAPPRTGELVAAHVRGRSPLTDVTVFQGGQPDHPVIIGVE